MTEFSPEQLDALFAAILVNDVVDAAVDLPASIRVDYPAGHLRDGFAISRELWAQGFDRDELMAIVTILCRSDAIDIEAQLQFKHARAKFKHLRFAFVLYGANHRCPVTFKAVTTTMGLLQDALRNGRKSLALRHAKLLRVLVTRAPQRLLRQEIARFQIGDPASFRAFTVSQIAAMRALLQADGLTAHAFHAARKIVSRQVSFHDDMRIVHPSPEHVQLSRYLSAINGLMGRHHDELLARRGRDLDYSRDTIVLPSGIRQRLTALVERYPA